MKKLMLIGDSIRMGYQPDVIELLGDEMTVTGPKENCRFSAFTLFHLTDWLGAEQFDVIHWNNGQWDTCYMPDGKIHTPLESYVDYQERIAKILMGHAKRLVFATTTPVWPELHNSGAVRPRNNQDINAYNAAVVERLSGLDITINDLNAQVKSDIKRYICEDMVHLTEEGSRRCARMVVDVVNGVV